jgi:hypothetical protein
LFFKNKEREKPSHPGLVYINPKGGKMLCRGARSSCPISKKRGQLSPQEEALVILKNLLTKTSKVKGITDSRWNCVCSCVGQIAEEMNRTIDFPCRKKSGRGKENGLKAIVKYCHEAERAIDQVKDLPPDLRLFTLEQLRNLRNEVV